MRASERELDATMDYSSAWRQGTMALPMNPMLLQHTLRGLCSNESQWVYAVFWRILPRNYPPPQWDTEGGIMDRSKGNKRNWILVWEDGFCNFAACAASARSRTAATTTTTTESRGSSNALFLSVRQQQQQQQQQEEPEAEVVAMNPELFFKMSHEVYNYGEGLMGKVAVDNSHKWVCRDPVENEIGFLSSPWQNTIDAHPRTWEGQFKSGIQTIAVVAVQEGVLQLGSTQKIMEDLNFVLYMQRKFNFLHSIPGMLMPHPAATEQGTPGHKRGVALDSMPSSITGTARSIDQFLSPHVAAAAATVAAGVKRPSESLLTSWPLSNMALNSYTTNAYGGLGFEQYRPECLASPPKALHAGLSHGGTSPAANLAVPAGNLLPSMSSLQALLSKLPSVTPTTENRVSYQSHGYGGGNNTNTVAPAMSHGLDLQRMVDGDNAMVDGDDAMVDMASPDFRHHGASKPRFNHNSAFSDSLDNFTEFGIQEALENGDSSYTSFLNEICS